MEAERDGDEDDDQKQKSQHRPALALPERGERLRAKPRHQGVGDL